MGKPIDGTRIEIRNVLHERAQKLKTIILKIQINLKDCINK